MEPNIDAAPPVLEGLTELVPVDAALERADILLLLVDHAEFRGVDAALLEGRTVIDTRGIWTGGPRRQGGLLPALAA